MNQRYFSLDVFRGATVALMILVNNPASWANEQINIFAPLRHAEWHGCTPTDLVFPFFLFAVGNAMAFVMPRFYAAQNDTLFWKKVLKRTFLIFGIGFFVLACAPYIRYTGTGTLAFKTFTWLNVDCKGLPTTYSGLRILGVLQRIALCYFFASVFVYYFKAKGALLLSLILLSWYNVVCYFGAITADPYSVAGYAGRLLDVKVLGSLHLIKEDGLPFDPEGLLSTIPAIASVIFGYLIGNYIQRKGKTYEMLSHLLVAGLLLILGGMVWETFMPINKKLWTSSYVVYTTGLATVILAVLIHAIEFKQLNKAVFIKNSTRLEIGLCIITFVCMSLCMFQLHAANSFFYNLSITILSTFIICFFAITLLRNKLFQFFDAFGKNPLFIFVLSGFLPRILSLIRLPLPLVEGKCSSYLNPLTWYGNIISLPAFSNPKLGSLMYACSLIIFYWLIAYIMDKKRIYVKV